MTRLQRASEGSSQSTRRGGNNVIQSCGVRLQNPGRNLIMLRYSAMHSEYYGLLFGRKISSTDGALHALNAHIGPVNHVRHHEGWYHGEWLSRRRESAASQSLFAYSR